MGPAHQPKGFWTKEVKICTTVIVIVLAVLFGTLFYLISNFTGIQMLPDPDPIPHSGMSVTDHRIYGPSDAVEYQVLGNASGEQYLAMVASGGSLYMYVSNDTFSMVVNGTLLDEVYGTDPATIQLRLGRDPLGRVAVSISRAGEVKGWVLEAWPDVWVPMDDPSSIFVPASPDIDPSSLPSPKHLQDWEDGWDTIWLEGREVAVGTYTYQAGCEEASCCPSIVFRTDDGEWSTIVVLGKLWVNKVQVAGTGLDDMFVVSYEIGRNGPRWYMTTIDGNGVLKTGQSPPARGID